MNLGRRGLLKFIGMAPAVAASMPAMSVSAAGFVVPGLTAVGQYAGEVVNYANPVASGASKFFSFDSWLKDIGREQIYKQSRDVRTIDPDIAQMRLPITTKVQWQRQRNFDRLMAERQTWFERRFLQYGHVEDWN